ncbi:hypothetical protein G9Q38_02755 [Pusillimonas sp. DMV24BSW_D]|uniref:hypothetical protein n=1 Tax=Neopusillimonas aestuarii TaxID=2716226 RepID=UPI001409B3B5|nr:hypothetical protein [Pusillimonas sp. DMV24BSW_D]QIM48171.1 hypothetical protein G9Q38_02755 [Pusillimonas sp. DMV24BSW_D]
MSWRIMFAILLVLAGASAWGGLRLGEWLVAHGPTATAAPGRPELAPVEVLDADGRPFSQQPPQPLVNGQLAIPQGVEPVPWQIAEQAAGETLASEVIAVSTSPITMVEAEQIAAIEQGRLSGIGDVGDLMSNLGTQNGNMPLQPVEMPNPPPPPPETPMNNTGTGQANWRAQLQDELQQCNLESFFDRPSCTWAARNKYCTPNNAWGQIDDCPSRNF